MEPPQDADAPLRRGSLEAQLHELWCDLLRVDSVHADDSFIALGGDSMLMIRMLVAVQTRYDCDLDFDRFFADPRFGTLLGVVESAN